MATNTETAPPVYSTEQFHADCAEASTLGLRPGFAPIVFMLQTGAQYRFTQRVTRDGETVAWTYQRVTGSPSGPDYLSILND